jgi:hypothetical protein
MWKKIRKRGRKGMQTRETKKEWGGRPAACRRGRRCEIHVTKRQTDHVVFTRSLPARHTHDVESRVIDT